MLTTTNGNNNISNMTSYASVSEYPKFDGICRYPDFKSDFFVTLSSISKFLPHTNKVIYYLK